jgi:TRAP-type C4-dicarboxylate transport system substrate-binding protein
MLFRALKADAVSALTFAALVAAGPASADPQYVMKITLPTIHEANWEAATEYAARVEKGSGGRIKTEVYPASQLGSIPRQIEGVQFGSIQCAFIPPEFYVGVDDRFQILAAPGLVDSMDNAQKVSQDPKVQKLMLSLGANKGLHGVGLFVATPSFLDSKSPIRHLADFKGKKIRVLASDFQMKAFERLGATSVAMSLGDVLPAIQQGAIDASVSGLTVFTTMSYQDAAKYVTEIQQPYIFIIIELSTKWRASLPPDLQKVVDQAAAEEEKAIHGYALEDLANGRKTWVAHGGELIDLPAEEQSAMMETFGSVGQDVSSKEPKLAAAYKIVTDAAKRDR